ncbi:hypothetical protein T07_1151 [Trichinella nelsoni]|uniref:Uncharacterized protein n=1 Tax=Trichinella nelsoni TaxID=6336 RepID=A0A0V0RDL7_9BILA|nr:hypothetical protein T07_1151 [Trichinella nelsoni]
MLDITWNIRFGSPCNLLSGVPPTNFASSYLCISALKSVKGSSVWSVILFNLLVPWYSIHFIAHIRICAVDRFANTCQDFLLQLLGFSTCFAAQKSGLPSTTFRLLYLFRLTVIRASNGYEWLIGLQTIVWSSFYQVFIFLPVYICTEAFVTVSPYGSQDFFLQLLGFSNCFASQKSERTNEYERLIGLQTLVRSSFYNVEAFQPVSPHRSQRTNEYERLIGLQTLVITSFYNVQAFQPVSPHRSQAFITVSPYRIKSFQWI